MFAEEVFLGHDLLAWLVLAFGAALVVGNVAALVRPPQDVDPDTGAVAPRGMRARAIVYAALGAIAAVWALATLLTA